MWPSTRETSQPETTRRPTCPLPVSRTLFIGDVCVKCIKSPFGYLILPRINHNDRGQQGAPTSSDTIAPTHSCVSVRGLWAPVQHELFATVHAKHRLCDLRVDRQKARNHLFPGL